MRICKHLPADVDLRVLIHRIPGHLELSTCTVSVHGRARQDAAS
jgi:hypothetical protein